MNGYRRELVSHQPENQVDLCYVLGAVHHLMLLTRCSGSRSRAHQGVALPLSVHSNIVCVC